MQDDTDIGGTDSAGATSNTDNTAIRDDDVLVNLDRTRQIMGDISVSTAYADPELMALKIKVTAGEGRPNMIRFIERRVLQLRAKRVARAEANAGKVRAHVEAYVERQRERRRLYKRSRSRNEVNPET